MSKTPEEKQIEEAQKRYDEMRKDIQAISQTPGYKKLIDFWKYEEQSLDNQLPMLDDKNLMVAVRVRATIKKFLQFQENVLKDNK